MKKIIKLASFALLLTGLTVTSCKKKTTTTDSSTTPATETDETASFTQHSSDVTTSSNSSDMSMDDAENAIGATPMGAKGAGTNSFSICGATVDTSALKTAKTITINYNGNSCDGLRNRTGSIVVKLVSGTRWRDAGAIISIFYNNFKVTTLSNNKSNTLNGTHFITNVSGGVIPHIGMTVNGFANPATIVRKIRSYNMSITFDDNTVRSWFVARTWTWVGSNGFPSGLTISGDTMLNGNSNTEIWGTNREGKTFSTVINTPIAVNSTCGWLAPVSGKKTHNINGRVSSITFGTDASGNVALPSSCPNHYLLTWTSLTNVSKSYVGTY